MTATAHLGIRDYVADMVSGLSVTDAVLGNREHPLAERATSQVAVFRVQSVPERSLVGTVAPIDWTTDLRVIIKTRQMDGTSAETRADDIITAIYAALMADQTLGGRVQLLDPGPIVWEQEEADHPIVVCAFEFRVVHRTTAHSLAAP